jgi:hypothetical protein
MSNSRRLYTVGRVIVFSILDPLGPRPPESPLERRKGKAMRPHWSRAVLKGLWTDLATTGSLKATPAEMINPSQETDN